MRAANVLRATRLSVEIALENKTSPVALIFSASLIAVLAGVIGWSMRSRVNANADIQRAEAAAQAMPVAQKEDPNALVTRSRTLPAPAINTATRDPGAMIADADAAASKVAAAGKQKLRTRYESERVDATWAQRKQQALQSLSVSPQIEEVHANPLSFAANCHSSVCLIAADFPSRVAADDWFSLYTMIAGEEMSNVSSEGSTNPDNTIHLQIYGLARK